MNTQFDMGRVSAQALAAVEATTPGTYEHGAAIAAALMEGYGMTQSDAAAHDTLVAQAEALETQSLAIIDAKGCETKKSARLWSEARAKWAQANEIACIAFRNALIARQRACSEWLSNDVDQIIGCIALGRLAT